MSIIKKLNQQLLSHYFKTINGKEFSSATCTIRRKDFQELKESPAIRVEDDGSILFRQSSGLIFKIRSGGKFRVRYRGVRSGVTQFLGKLNAQ